MEETIRIVKRNNEEVTFSIHKIVEAINAAVSKLVDECLEELYDSIQRTFYSIVHSAWHWLMRLFDKENYRKEKSISCPLHAYISTAVLFSCVKPVTSVFCRFSQRIRNIYLLRTQDRSTDADSADNNFIHFVTTTV